MGYYINAAFALSGLIVFAAIIWNSPFFIIIGIIAAVFSLSKKPPNSANRTYDSGLGGLFQKVKDRVCCKEEL